MEQVLRQGCLLTPLVLDIFFTAVLRVELQRFSDHPEILSDLVHLLTPAAERAIQGPGESKSLLSEVLRAVWGML